MLDASVVVCTRNRARLLDVTLGSLAAQTFESSRFEVVIVDNASTDATPEVAARWQNAGRWTVRHVVESRLGTNHARNRGVAEARGRVIAFLDDDARAEPEWLDALLGTLEEEQAAGVGGRIELWWESSPPRWLTEKYLRSLLAEFDLGDVRCPVERFPYLVGTNLALSAEVIARVGGFHGQLERRSPLSAAGMEDVELCHRVVRSGGTLVYEPRAVVHHFVPDDRATLSFLLRRSYADGRAMLRYQRLTGQTETGSRPRRLVKSLAAVPVRLLRGERARSAAALAFAARHLGYLREGGRFTVCSVF